MTTTNDELRPNPYDVHANPLSVPCPKCGVAAGETCPPPGPCGLRFPAARLDVRRAADRAQQEHTFQTGLAKVRAALEEAGQRRRHA